MWVSGSGSWRKLFGYASIPFAVYVLSPWFPGSLYIRRWKAVVSHWEKLPMLLAIYSFLKLVAFVRLFFYCYLIIDGSWADWYTQGKLKFNHFCSTWIISDYEWKNPCLYSVHTVSVVTPQHMFDGKFTAPNLEVRSCFPECRYASENTNRFRYISSWWMTCALSSLSLRIGRATTIRARRLPAAPRYAV